MPRHPDDTRRSERATIRDVARESGLSIGTVSRVLNNHPWVSPASLQAVTAAIQKTGFVPNARARSLATHRTQRIALVLGMPPTTLFEDSSYAHLLEVLTQSLAISGYFPVLMTAESDTERRRVIEYLRGANVDGVFFLASKEPLDAPTIELLQEQALPTVLYVNTLPKYPSLISFSSADTSGASRLGEHFRMRGYQRVAVIAPVTGAERQPGLAAAFRDGLGKGSVITAVTARDYSRQAGYEATETMLAMHTRPRAIFAVSDELAAGGLEALHAAGLSVPSQVAIAGFGDTTLATRTSPALTSVRRPIAEIAHAMITEILNAIEGRHGSSRQLPTRLVVRDSA